MAKFDTVLPADSVLNLRLPSGREVLLCATYFLKENITDEHGRLRAIRKGEVLAFSWSEDLRENAESKSVQVIGRSGFESGVLDLQVLANTSNSTNIATVHSNGNVCVIAVASNAECSSDSDAISLECKSTVTIPKHDEALALAVSTGSSIHNAVSNTVCVSDSVGQISTFALSDGSGLAITRTWKAHDFECWTLDMACRDGECNSIASGGDDAKLCFWDTRTDCCKATSTVRYHEAGVCGMRWHPSDPNLFASGSYDEQLAIWDVRKLAQPLVSQKLDGGVWRIRWLAGKSDAHAQTMLTATMYAGAHVVKADVNSASSRILQHYKGHSSIVYGAEWLSGREHEMLVASCSFYDHALHFWTVNIGDDSQTGLEKDFAAAKI